MAALATLVPPELGYEAIGQQAPMVRSKVRVQPLQPTYISNTVGGDTIRFRLPAATAQLVLMDSIRFTCQFQCTTAWQCLDPVNGLAGLFSRIVLRSNGTVIQDTQQHDFIQSFLNLIASKPAPYEGVYTGKSGWNLTNRYCGQDLKYNRRGDATFFGNAMRCMPSATSITVLQEGYVGTSNVSTTYTTNAGNGHNFNHRFNIGLFNYPYAIPLSLLRDLEIELTLASATNLLVDFGVPTATGSPAVVTYTPASGGVTTFSLFDIGLEMDLLVVPDAMAQSMSADLNKGSMAMIPTLQWTTQLQSLQLQPNSTLVQNIVLSQVLSSVRAIFVLFFQNTTSLNKGVTSSFPLCNPGYDDSLSSTARGGGVISAQLQIQGTSLIPEEPMTNRNRMMRHLRQSLLLCGLQDMDIQTLRDYVVFPSQTLETSGTTDGSLDTNILTRVGGYSTTSAAGPITYTTPTIDELEYGQYGTSITFPGRCGGKFALGFPCAPSYATDNVMNGIKVEHNAVIKLQIANNSASVQNYTAMVLMANQSIIRLSAMGTVDTLT